MRTIGFIFILCFLVWPSITQAVILQCQYIDEATGEVVEDPTVIPPTMETEPDETEEGEGPAPETTLVNIQLSELYPAPVAGQEEFIELYNPNDQAISVNGLKLTDASGKTFTISEATIESTSVAAHSYLVLPYSTTKIILNNSGDTVIITNESGAILDQTTYASALSGFSWSRHIGITDPETRWDWTSLVTQGTANMFVEDEANAEPVAQQLALTQEPVPTTQPTGGSPTITAPTTTQPIAEDTRQTASTIKINELLPNAVGSDTNTEWIELVNTGKEAVRLIDWTLSDASKTYPIGDVTLGAGELLLLESSATRISLNNSGETVTLTDPFDSVIDSVEYGASTEGQSYARFSDAFSWTADPTPGTANKLVKVSVVETKKSDDGDEKSTDGSSSLKKVVAPAKTTTPTNVKKVAAAVGGQKTSIAAAKILEEGAEVVVNGVVTALPGQLGSQYFLLQDASGGVQVYSYAKLFPDLKFGDRVTVSGEVGVSRETKRVKITQASDIVVNGAGEAVAPKAVDELNETLEGQLVQTSSVLAEKSGLNWNLDNGVVVGLKGSSGVSNKDFKEGGSVTVVGIVEQSGGSYRIAPRQADDVKSGGGDAAEDTGAEAEKDDAASAIAGKNSGDGAANGSVVTTKKASGNKTDGKSAAESGDSALVMNVKNHPWMSLGILLTVVAALLYFIRRNWNELEQKDWMKRLLRNPRVAKIVEQLKTKGWLPKSEAVDESNSQESSEQKVQLSSILQFHNTASTARQNDSQAVNIIDDDGVFYALSEQFRQRPS